MGAERLERNNSGSLTGEFLSHGVILAVLVERLFQEIHNPLLNDLQFGVASPCQPDAELRLRRKFMALLKEKWEYSDLFTFKAILKVIIEFGEPSFPGADFDVEKESSSLVSAPLFPVVLVFWKIFLVQIINEVRYVRAQEGHGFPYVFRPFIY